MSDSEETVFRKKFNKESFFSIVEEASLKHPTRIKVNQNPIVKNIYGYLDDLDANHIIVEKKYIDKDFRIDYSTFYSRCFHNYERECFRLHFFEGDKNPYSLIKKLLNPTENQKNYQENHQILNNCYLGFIVIKPLPSHFIGKTVLKTYPKEDLKKEKKRYYNKLTNYKVSLCGISLEIKSVAFMEQDPSVAACATISIWVTLHKLKDLLFTKISPPSELTSIISKGVTGLGRTFPSEGFNVYQIMGFLNKCGFETMTMDTTQMSVNEIKRIIYAYSKFGLPVLAILDMKRKSDVGLHIVSILGHDLPLGNKKNSLIKKLGGKHIFFESDLIEEFYVHDDQICPFSRFKLIKANKVSNNWSKIGWEVKINRLIIPLYETMRLTYNNIISYFDSRKLAEILINSAKKDKKSWFMISIYLSDNQSYKNELSFEHFENKFKILTSSLPKYIFILRIYKKENKFLDLIFDTTDIKESPILVVSYSNSD